MEEPLLMAPSGALLLVFPSLCSSFWEEQDSARALRPLQETLMVLRNLELLLLWVFALSSQSFPTSLGSVGGGAFGAC